MSDRPIHADFQELTVGETIRITIPIQLLGTAAGQLEGGVTQQIISELEIECLPKDIPGQIEIDISALNIGDSLHVSDLVVGDVTILTGLDSTVVIVAGAAPEEEEIVDELGIEGEEGEEGEEGAEGEEGDDASDDQQS